MTATLERSPVAIHPRMRSRRIAVQRSVGRRRLRRALMALGVVTGLVTLYTLALTPLLDVDDVRVRGADRASAEAIAAASGIAAGEPMIHVDTDGSARRIEELAWVAEARVQRVWPGTVRIEVEERSPVGVIQVTDSHTALVDGTGRVLTIGQERPPELAALEGVKGRVAEGDVLSSEAREAAAVLDGLVERLPEAVIAMSTDLEATLADGGVVRFGTTDDLEDKLVATETVLADVSLTCLQVLDVRVPGNPTLTRHAGCS